jgi:hypothetical protein
VVPAVSRGLQEARTRPFSRSDQSSKAAKLSPAEADKYGPGSQPPKRLSLLEDTPEHLQYAIVSPETARRLTDAVTSAQAATRCI